MEKIMTTENKDIPSVFTGRKSKTGAAEKEYTLRSLQRRENHTKGQYSEDTAAEYLKSQGYRVLERNWRFHRNEIDIIAMDGSCLVFVEVKARKSSLHGFGFEAVDCKKQRLIRKVAEAYLIFRHLSLTGTPCRFDVISIDGDTISLFKNAF